MCGVAGFLSPELNENTMHEYAALMAKTLAHRGPDGEGIWVEGNIALAHRRLSIIDLSDQGAQPMQSSSGRYVLSFNGEIYNFKQLRKKLEDQGHSFRGHSDTEVLLGLIDQIGLEETLPLCHGMFALALWDNQDKILKLARDRMGEKPLYYGWVENDFVFASELSSIEALPHFKGEISPVSLSQLLQFSCIPAPHSIYKSISKLKPGHILKLNWAQNKEDVSSAYWTLTPKTTPTKSSASFSETADEIEGQLKEILKNQMIADVPLGAFLSGGIDSSLIVSLMQEISNEPIQTFTMGFDDPVYNEAGAAKEVAQHLGTDHTEVTVTEKMALDLVPELHKHYSEPFADSSQIPTILVCKIAKSAVKVCLSGDGGDEVFGGYNRYIYGEQLWKSLSRTPLALRKYLLKPSLNTFEFFMGSSQEFLGLRMPKNKLQKIKLLMNSASAHDFYINLLSQCQTPSDFVLNTHFKDPFTPETLELSKTLHMVDKMSYLDAQFYLPDDILVKTDRASMSTGLELRVPFLDHQLVEKSFQLPLEYKIKNNKGKQIPRHLLKKRLPENLFDRPKMGFAVPLSSWLRGKLRPWAEELLNPKSLAEDGFLNVSEVGRIWTAFLKGQDQWTFLLWNILMFQCWYKNRK